MIMFILWLAGVVVAQLVIRKLVRGKRGAAVFGRGGSVAFGCIGCILAGIAGAAMHPYVTNQPDPNGLVALTYGIAAAPFGALLGVWVWSRLG